MQKENKIGGKFKNKGKKIPIRKKNIEGEKKTAI
jgi:hypothetical protein